MKLIFWYTKKYLNGVVLFLLIIVILPVQTARAWPASYSQCRYRKLIDLDVATTVNDYQVKLMLTNVNFDYTNVSSDASDIRFSDVNDNIMPYYIEEWSSGEDTFDFFNDFFGSSSGVAKMISTILTFR